MKCRSRIALGPYSETYCMLDVGHSGACSNDKNSDVVMNFLPSSKQQCLSPRVFMPGDGVTCGLPSGHAGRHANATALSTWE